MVHVHQVADLKPFPGISSAFLAFYSYFLLIVHLFIMHVTNDVACTTYDFVAMRYANPFWRLFDWLLLTLALTHGMNGLRVVIDDYVRSPRTRLILLSLCCDITTVVFFMLGTITLVTFHPVAGVWVRNVLVNQELRIIICTINLMWSLLAQVVPV